MEVMLALFVFGIDKEGEVMIKGKNISKNFVSRKIFWLLVIAVILLLVGIHFRTKSSSDIPVKDAEKQIEENLRTAGVSEYEKIDLQAYEKQAGVDLSKYVSYRFFIPAMI